MTFLYLRLNLSDEGCWGLIEGMYTVLLFILFAVTIPFAFMAAYRKRQPHPKKPELFTLTITLVTLAVLIIGKIFGDDFKGSIWIYAEANKDKLLNQYLTLRNNGTFKVDLGHVDFSCYFSGQYQTHSDTIILDKDVVAQTNFLLTTKYLLQDNLLMPISDKSVDSTKYSEFVINSKR